MLKVTAAKLSDLYDLVNRGKEFLDCFGIFFELTKANGFLLFKLGFPQNFWISSSTQLGEHPNFGLNAEEGFP